MKRYQSNKYSARDFIQIIQWELLPKETGIVFFNNVGVQEIKELDLVFELSVFYSIYISEVNKLWHVFDTIQSIL